MRELEGADVPGAHHMRSRAQVEKSPFLKYEIGSFSGMCWTISSLNLLGAPRSERPARRPLWASAKGLGPRDDDFLKGLICFDNALQLRLDAREIFRRNPVLQFEIVIETVFDGRAGGSELRVRPELENGRRQNVRAGMANPLQFRHFLAVVERLALRFGALWFRFHSGKG